MNDRASGRVELRISLCLLTCGSVCTPGCSRRELMLEGAVSTMLDVKAPPELFAGEPLPITLTLDAPSDVTALILHGSYGPLVYRSREVGNGETKFRVSQLDTRARGVVSLVPFGNRRAQSIVEIRPGAAVDPIVPLVGPRSIVADGAHWTMCTVVPLDRFNNVVAEGTSVALTVQHAARSVESFVAGVEHLVAWRRIYSDTTSGRAMVLATASGKLGPDASFSEVPGPPVPFALSALPEDAPADGRTVIEWKAGPLEDRYGNELLDGTHVGMLSTTPPLGYFFSDAVVVGGMARRLVRAPTSRGLASIQSTVLGVPKAHAEYQWRVGPAAGSVSVRVEVGSDEMSIVAGPFATASGSYPPDGIDVEFSLHLGDSAEQVRREQLDSGYARTKIPLAHIEPGTVFGSVRLGEAVAEFGPVP